MNGDGAGPVLRDGPTRPTSGQNRKLHHAAAAARTVHRREPTVVDFTDQVDGVGAQEFGEKPDANDAVGRLRATDRRPRAKRGEEGRAQHIYGYQLRSGMPSMGVASPRPTCCANKGSGR